MEYSHGYSIESGLYGVKIMLSTPGAISKEAEDFSRDHAEKLMEEIRKSDALSDPKILAARLEMKLTLLGLFRGIIYAKEIPNEYCSRSCCVDRPWLMVTLPIGHIKIGWRKRVIEIDWSETDLATEADSLFPEEKVTKGRRYIHAWSYEDAKRYIEKLTGANGTAICPGGQSRR